MKRKQYLKEQNIMYKKQYDSVKKKKIININDDNDDVDNLIIRNNEIEIKEGEDNNLDENLIDTKNDNERSNSYNEPNSLDISLGGNIALTSKQKNMINTIDKNLEKKNEESNFDDMNQIQKTIKLIIRI